MDLSMSLTNIQVKPDYRDNLYYNKYTYRARLTMDGLRYLYGCKSFKDYLKKLNRIAYRDSKKQNIANISLDDISNFMDWRDIAKKSNKCTIRIEYNTAGIFSNDLDFLKTLESIKNTNIVIDYSEIIEVAPMGTKLFKKEPKYKYRAYLKSKRVKDTFKKELTAFIDRYKGTGTVVIPSKALKDWLADSHSYWYGTYCSSHYYIDYQEESTNSLIALMFGDMVKRRYKLEKRQG
jgi:hypothetical protein